MKRSHLIAIVIAAAAVLAVLPGSYLFARRVVLQHRLLNVRVSPPPARMLRTALGNQVIVRRLVYNQAAVTRLSAVQIITSPRTFEYRSFRFLHSIVRVGQDYTLGAGEEVRDINVFAGTVTIDGHVDGDVIVTAGTLNVSSTAVIDGSIVAIGTNTKIAQDAVVRRDLMIIGGALDAPAGFVPNGEHVVVGTTWLGNSVGALVPWLVRGLALGRPIVPDLPWVWGVAGVFFLIAFLLNAVFDRPVRECAAVVGTRPFGAFFVGLLVLLLSVPLIVILAATVVGIVVIPFVIAAAVVAWMLGRVGVARAIGASVWHQHDPESRLLSLRSFLIGSAVVCITYMVPLLGFITWAMVGTFGLGAATLTCIAAMRREFPPKVAVSPMAPAAPAPPPMSSDSHPYASLSLEPATVADAPHAEHETPAPPNAPADARAAATNLLLFPRATFLDRVAAFALDCVLLAIANTMLDFARHDGMFLLVLFAYHVAFWTWKGTTLGGIICNVRVVSANGGELRFVDALVRGLSSLFSIAVLGIGCLWMLNDPERQMWHDKIAGTVVVRVPRGWPLP